MIEIKFKSTWTRFNCLSIAKKNHFRSASTTQLKTAKSPNLRHFRYLSRLNGYNYLFDHLDDLNENFSLCFNWCHRSSG